MFGLRFLEIRAFWIYGVFGNIEDKNRKTTLVGNFNPEVSQQRGIFGPFLNYS